MIYYLYIDESGDHGLTKVNPLYPIFTLCGIVVSEPDNSLLCNEFNKIKFEFWKSIDIIFHSNKIRRCDGKFQIFLDDNVKNEFYNKLNNVVTISNYKIK